ncbi:hypothetical protein PCS93_21890 [Escherichia coli]|nr:hypothetical protein PCS93_21890 [Escherichia coli]
MGTTLSTSRLPDTLPASLLSGESVPSKSALADMFADLKSKALQGNSIKTAAIAIKDQEWNGLS